MEMLLGRTQKPELWVHENHLAPLPENQFMSVC
jgi:hypothetical protein